MGCVVSVEVVHRFFMHCLVSGKWQGCLPYPYLTIFLQASCVCVLVV